MIILKSWHSYKKIGLVTDQCPVCQRRRHFHVKRVRQWHSVQLIFIFPSIRSDYLITCSVCGTAISRHPKDYPQLQKSWWTGYRVAPGWIEPPADVDEVRSDGTVITSAPAPDRMALIREPFLKINEAIQARAAQIYFDGWSKCALVLTIGVPLYLFFGANAVQQDRNNLIACIVFFVGLGATTWMVVTDVPRWLRSRHLPKIVAALAPLHPTLEELQQVEAEFKAHHLKLGRLIKSHRLHEALEAYRKRQA
ncbi:MAG: hypothetical protein WD768_00250 [Phycisphaeraceae bacterium]